MTNEQEFNKIRDAFEKVKKDVFFLTQKVNRLENSKNDSENKLIKEIELLKLKMYTLENGHSSNEEIHYVIGNSDSKKVHMSNCPYAHKISKDHIQRFDTLKDALKQGYDTCSCTHN
jgi:hypothetical protein